VVFKAVQKLNKLMQDSYDTSKMCSILRFEMAPLLKSDLVLFLRYRRDSASIELLASSDPTPHLGSIAAPDQSSLEWIEERADDDLIWFQNLDSAPLLLQEWGKSWGIEAMAVFFSSEVADTKDIIIVSQKEKQDESWKKTDEELLEFLRGAMLVLESLFLINESNKLKSDIQSVFNMAPVGIIMIDSTGMIINANKHAISMLGCGIPLDDVIGDNILSGNRFKGCGLDEVVRKTLGGEETETENMRYKSSSGRICYLHVMLQPVPMTSGKMHAIGVLADVTQRVRLQQQLERSYHTLTEAFQELQRVDKMKTRFIDVVSHELRTPLTVMRGYLELLSSEYKDKMDPKIISKLQTIKANTDRLYDIVESMLDVARIEKGAMEITKQESSVRALVEGVVSSQKPMAQEKHQEIDIVTIGEVSSAKMDAKKLHDALKNILNNAIRYTPEGGKIQVGMADEGKMIHIWIRDNGIGIPLADLEKIFDRFHIVVAKELSHQVNRMGLGLPIAKGIIENHGGKIWVESEPDKGSIFHIKIPKD
jgi:PAS domain S-box-containing protein